MKWFFLRASFVISISEWYEDDTNTRGRCLFEMFGAAWSSPRHICVPMTRDSEGYVGSNDQRACTAPWIIPRNVNWLGLCCGIHALAIAGPRTRVNNRVKKNGLLVAGSPSGVSCKYAPTILLQPHQSWQIWQDPFVPNKESKHSWSHAEGTSPLPYLATTPVGHTASKPHLVLWLS